ncbi:MAG TPA: cation-translocating P-type ATPase, partial [Symbiobacteriaceae bacterium]|nr:cation-translocating P-type ATPase [Symbiobacteriaceae bacterium]
GLLGLMDPPRPEVPPALERCRRAGIKVLMLTGDHPRTAEAVAREIGLLGPGDLIMTGDEIAALDDAALGRCVERLRVGARVSPEQKLRVVRALRKKGHVVAMTGDGVNDAPAVKEADIGIAMGLSGTDVTKEAAALILADDNFATIVAAVEQGRVTYNNIRRSIRYLLASNLGEVILMVAAVFLGLPLPLIPLQILWLNLVGDGLPALALGAEPADGSEMHRPPRPRQESIFAGGLGSRIVRHGARMGVAALGLYLWALRSGRALPVVRTLTLCGLVLGQLIYLYRCRGRDRKNPLVTWAVVASLGMLAASVLFAPLRTMLQLTPLGLRDWTAAAVAAGLGAL